MPLADESVELVFAKIGNVGKKRGGMIVQSAPSHDPTHVRPESTITRRVRIAFHVSILVMDPVRRDPEKRAAFQRQRGAEGDEIFEPFIGLETAMREQPVIGNADSQAAGDPPQKQSDEKGLPGKHEKRCNRTYVKCDHEKCSEFADWFPKCSIPFEKVHECESPWWLVPACFI
jgi:hypothetical protein